MAKEITETMMRRHGGHMGSITFQQKRIALFEDMYASLERGYGSDNLCYANMCLWHFLSSFLYDDQFSLSKRTAGKTPWSCLSAICRNSWRRRLHYMGWRRR